MANMKPASSLKTNVPNKDHIVEILNALKGTTQFDDVYTPRVYRAKLEQNGAVNSAPTASVFANTTGATITWVYDSAGRYIASASSGIFSPSNCSCIAHLGAPLSSSVEFSLHAFVSGSTSDQVVVQCYDSGSAVDNTRSLVNGFYEGQIEILVHTTI